MTARALACVWTTLEIISAMNGTERVKGTYELLPDGQSMRLTLTALAATGKPGNFAERVLRRE